MNPEKSRRANSEKAKLASINTNLRRLGIPAIERVRYETQGTDRLPHDPNIGMFTICMVSNATRSQWPLFGLGAAKKSIKDQLNGSVGRRLAFDRAVRSYINAGQRVAEQRRSATINLQPPAEYFGKRSTDSPRASEQLADALRADEQRASIERLANERREALSRQTTGGEPPAQVTPPPEAFDGLRLLNSSDNPAGTPRDIDLSAES